jgi:hypothetical protein
LHQIRCASLECLRTISRAADGGLLWQVARHEKLLAVAHPKLPRQSQPISPGLRRQCSQSGAPSKTMHKQSMSCSRGTENAPRRWRHSRRELPVPKCRRKPDSSLAPQPWHSQACRHCAGSESDRGPVRCTPNYRSPSGPAVFGFGSKFNTRLQNRTIAHTLPLRAAANSLNIPIALRFDHAKTNH